MKRFVLIVLMFLAGCSHPASRPIAISNDGWHARVWTYDFKGKMCGELHKQNQDTSYAVFIFGMSNNVVFSSQMTFNSDDEAKKMVEEVCKNR